MKHINPLLSAVIFLLATLLFSSCKNDDTLEKRQKNLTGYVQKGPFINGSSVTVYDLRGNLSPTGKSFYSQILDNNGTFGFNDLSLTSTYVSLRADGFYFNEVSGTNSAAPITLNAMANITNKNGININLLTHLEKPRVEFLLKNGYSYEQAKFKAQKEILAIFNIDQQGMRTSEDLNINESGNDNGALLAISVLLQGYRSESELTELLSTISNDIREDGILNDDYSGSALIDHAVYLDTAAIKTSLAQRYSTTGSTVSIPSFGKYITNFIEHTSFSPSLSQITYPENGLYGKNILSLNDTIYSNSSDYSLAADIPKSHPLKVTITALQSTGIWWINGSGKYWSFNTFNLGKQTFIATQTGIKSDLNIRNLYYGRYLIEYYELNSSVPTRRKIIRIK